jgi:glycosyltransferase involved in cell wall biosynthesis
MPLRDDWTSAAELISRLDSALREASVSAKILLVDDGSINSWDSARFAPPFRTIESIDVLRLRRNLGHQRAIAVGLGYLERQLASSAVIVMDADGEDTPDGVLRLLAAFRSSGGRSAVFAERIRRSESWHFRFFYQLYRLSHLALTGIRVRVGNFSILPYAYLSTLVVHSELWNHYAAAIFNSRLQFSLVPVPRGTRIDGKSQMNFVALVAHGLSAISVFGDRVGVRMLIASLSGCALALAGIAVVLLLRMFTNLAIPGWATYAVGTLVIILIQLVAIAASFTFFMLSNRMNLGFVPLRDYSLFISEKVEIYRRE